MNKQPTQRGIEWTDYTWNPVGGCQHACRWQMPDGSVAVCYAETVAERLATSAYPHGFAHHYWRPEALQAPLKLGTPAKIFLDSMSDLMGKWIPDEQVEAVLDICRQAHWHTFQLLTKNAPRLLQFRFPPNVWVGVSAPPSWMLGKQLTADQQKRMVERQCEVLAQINVPVRWMSIEPLSFDIAPLLKGAPLEWAVIGAATNGRRTYQPRAEWIQSLLELFDQQGVKVFFKGNLEWQPWREEFPASPVQATPRELPLDIRPNPASYFEPPVKPKRRKRSAAQAEPIQAPAHDAQESVTASTASADAIKAELERCEKEARVIGNVLKAAEIAPSRVNIEAAQADLAALRERQAELQAQLDALKSAAQQESVTPIALAEPSAAQANGAQVIRADIVRRWYGSDVTATLRTIAADRLRGDVIVMALDAPIATYRNGALAPELVTLARRCTVPSHTLRVTTPSTTRTTVVYLVKLEHEQRLISLPISDAAEKLRKSGAHVIEAMPYERYERYLSAAQRKRDAAERQAIEAFDRAHAERNARLEMSALSVAPAQAEQAAPSSSVTCLAVSVTTARAETAKTRVGPATLARAIALDHAIAALELRLGELRAERAKLLAELVSDSSFVERTTAPSTEPRAPKPKMSACEALGRRRKTW